MKKAEIYAYYFPNWHVDERNEQWHGKGWTEWNVVKCALPKFEGHYQPRVPLWGYEDESNPTVMAKKIDCATKYGIDGFVFDWYWVDGKPYRKKCIEDGFLKAENCGKIKFALMLCNHDPSSSHPSPRTPRSYPLGTTKYTPDEFDKITSYCIEHYFDKKNYIRIDGKLYFSIFSLGKFIMDIGGIESAKREIDKFRAKVRDRGLGEIHLSSIDNQGALLRKILNSETGDVDVVGKQGGKVETDFEAYNVVAKVLGLDSVNTHLVGLPPTQEFPKAHFDGWLDNYEDFCKTRNSKYEIPYNLCVTVGWDPSPRTVQSDVYEEVGYPYTKIIYGNTPEKVGKLFEIAKNIYEREETTAKCIFLHSFNEWTEGAYLEPDEKYGYGYLEELKRVFKNN